MVGKVNIFLDYNFACIGHCVAAVGFRCSYCWNCPKCNFKGFVVGNLGAVSVYSLDNKKDKRG